MKTTHTCKRIEDGQYLYRGYQIFRDDSVSAGYYGRWQVGIGKKGTAESSLQKCKSWVDREIKKGIHIPPLV